MSVTIDEGGLADVFVRYDIARLRVFGSGARRTATPDNDIDVLYELERGRRLGWEIEELPDELGVVFGRPVDLVLPRRGVHLRGLGPRWIRFQVDGGALHDW